MHCLSLPLPCAADNHRHVHMQTLLNLGFSGPADCTHLLPNMCAGHYPTWESAVGGFASAKDFRQLRKRIAADPSSLKAPKPLGPRPRRIPAGEYNSFGQGHALPFPGLSRQACSHRGNLNCTFNFLFVDHATPSHVQHSTDNVLTCSRRRGRDDAHV